MDVAQRGNYILSSHDTEVALFFCNMLDCHTCLAFSFSLLTSFLMQNFAIVSLSMVVKGVAFKKNLAHRRMSSRIEKPRLMILGGALEYQRVSNMYSSFDTLLQQVWRIVFKFGPFI